jgi:hypothetical protein
MTPIDRNLLPANWRRPIFGRPNRSSYVRARPRQAGDAPVRTAAIGSTFVGKPWQRTIVNTEAKYLMLVESADIGVIQRADGADFALKAVGKLFGGNLDGNVAPDLRITRPPYLSHAAFAQQRACMAMGTRKKRERHLIHDRDPLSGDGVGCMGIDPQSRCHTGGCQRRCFKAARHNPRDPRELARKCVRGGVNIDHRGGGKRDRLAALAVSCSRPLISLSMKFRVIAPPPLPKLRKG